MRRAETGFKFKSKDKLSATVKYSRESADQSSACKFVAKIKFIDVMHKNKSYVRILKPVLQSWFKLLLLHAWDWWVFQ